MIYIALSKAVVLMALTAIFFSLFWCEMGRRHPGIAVKLVGAFFAATLALNFVLFAYRQVCCIGSGQIGLAFGNLISMGVACFAVLFPLAYAWWKLREERKAHMGRMILGGQATP